MGRQYHFMHKLFLTYFHYLILVTAIRYLFSSSINSVLSQIRKGSKTRFCFIEANNDETTKKSKEILICREAA